MQYNRKRMLLTGFAVLAVLALAFVILLRGSGTEALGILREVSLECLTVPLLLEAGYQAVDSCICRTVVRTRIPDFPFSRAWIAVHLNIFGDVASFGAASIPMQSYLLYCSGMPVGAGIGLMTLRYVFHKASILLYASILLLLQWPWLKQHASHVMRYLPPAYAVIALIITALVLVCTWSRVQHLALWGLDKLPRNGKWSALQEKLKTQLDTLYTESRLLFRNKICCAKILLLNACKLFLRFSSPYACMWALGISCPEYFPMHLLSALMLLLTSVLPSVAGVGPTEFAFLLIFAPYIGTESALLALLLYRAVTYYVPFLVSMIPFCMLGRISGDKHRLSA